MSVVCEHPFSVKEDLSKSVLEWQSKKQDKTLLKKIFDESQRYLFAAAADLCKDAHIVQNIVDHETSRLWDYMTKYAGRAEFTTYLNRCIRNALSDDKRRFCHAQKFLSLEKVERHQRERETPDLSANLIHQELLDQISKAFIGLPQEYRTVWDCYITPNGETQPYREVGSITSRSEESIRAILHRARTHLRRELSSYLLAG